ncbi:MULTISPECIES: hypothetical protein [unclassified Synechococcus]|uniref:hypothetical protein n=1 Tax=unclassified Synechococcus TaxID=2626047 RepID=UPI001F1A42C1|nr:MULTISPECIES: hypothetical protein [unclassified Synechococcus]
MIPAFRGTRPGIGVDGLKIEAINIQIRSGRGQRTEQPKGSRCQQEFLEQFHWILTPIEGATVRKLGASVSNMPKKLSHLITTWCAQRYTHKPAAPAASAQSNPAHPTKQQHKGAHTKRDSKGQKKAATEAAAEARRNG